MKIRFQVITRCTRPQNLLQIYDSFKYTENSQYFVLWHVLFDTSSLIDIDSKLLLDLDKVNAHLHFVESDGSDYLYPQISEVVSNINTGWVVIMDDDNICYPNYFDILNDEIRTNVKSAYEFIEKLYAEYPDKFGFIEKPLCYYNALDKESKPRVPKVLYIGEDTPQLKSIKYADYEDDSLIVKHVKNDDTIDNDIIEFKPDSIISISKDYFNDYIKLCQKPIYIRNKWINLDEYEFNTGEIAYNCAMHNMLRADYDTTVSFFTPIYNTKDKLWKTYESVRNQTYPNWEWVVVNDSSDGGKTLKIALEIASQDHRVRVYDFREKSGGIIGESKYRAATLTKGKWLAELDHDDYLMPDCARYIIEASVRFPDVGFIYTDSVELDEFHNSMTYPDGFCFGYGKYRKEYHYGKTWDVVDSANINPKTIRHIVGVPNHIRTWRRDVYFEVGGHNRDLAIADDYELIVRTFLKTKFVRIPKLGYLQYIYHNANGRNTHDLSRADIQRRVRSIMYFYNDAINERFKELGVIDYAYEENKDNPLNVESRFGEDENYVNYIYNDL